MKRAPSPPWAGTHTSFLPEGGLQRADYVVRGEGFEKIQNLSHLENGRVVNAAERPKLPNLDVNPMADYSLISGWKPGGVISVATSRGCPFSCTFCSVPGMYGHAFRTHSVGRVLEELQHHKGTMYTFFADDIFTANKKRVKELMRGMIDRDLTPEWGAQVRTETVDDPELLQMMRDSNCFTTSTWDSSPSIRGRSSSSRRSRTSARSSARSIGSTSTKSGSTECSSSARTKTTWRRSTRRPSSP